MWKWVATAAGIYGMLCMGLVLAPRQSLQRVEQLPPAARQSSPRRDAEREGRDQLEPRGIPARPLDFQGNPQRVSTRPPGQAEVVSGADGGTIIRWHPQQQPEHPAVLLIPLKPGHLRVSQLVLRIRADRDQVLVIQLLEAQGITFQVERFITSAWAEMAIPLDEFKPSPWEKNIQQQLQVKRIHAMGLVQPPALESQRAGERAPAVIEIQTIRLD